MSNLITHKWWYRKRSHDSFPKCYFASQFSIVWNIFFFQFFMHFINILFSFQYCIFFRDGAGSSQVATGVTERGNPQSHTRKASTTLVNFYSIFQVWLSKCQSRPAEPSLLLSQKPQFSGTPLSFASPELWSRWRLKRTAWVSLALFESNKLRSQNHINS